MRVLEERRRLFALLRLNLRKFRILLVAGDDGLHAAELGLRRPELPDKHVVGRLSGLHSLEPAAHDVPVVAVVARRGKSGIGARGELFGKLAFLVFTGGYLGGQLLFFLRRGEREVLRHLDARSAALRERALKLLRVALSVKQREHGVRIFLRSGDFLKLRHLSELRRDFLAQSGSRVL